MYGFNSMEESASKICTTIHQQPEAHAVVVMAHNGPSGLGSEQHDICGKDWSDKAGKTLVQRGSHSCNDSCAFVVHIVFGTYWFDKLAEFQKDIVQHLQAKTCRAAALCSAMVTGLP